MASRTLRRRLHHGDVGGRKHETLDSAGLDGLDEPLLGSYDYDDKHSEGYTDGEAGDDEYKKARLHWALTFSNLIAQWAQWLANIVLGSGSFLKRLLPPNHNGLHRTNISFSLSPLQETEIKPLHLQNLTIHAALRYEKQTSRNHMRISRVHEERLKNLQQRLEVPFDGNYTGHQDALKCLWRLAYPDKELPPLKSELWKEMGWQGTDPSTDFRGGGYVSLENLIFFAKTYPDSFQKLLYKRNGKRAEWEYPFAVAGINISFMLIQMLDLHSGKPTSVAGVRFLELLGEDEMAFDNLFCVAFEMMDAQWLAQRASYMQFNEILKSTRTQLERELALEDVSTVKDLPMYNLLHK